MSKRNTIKYLYLHYNNSCDSMLNKGMFSTIEITDNGSTAILTRTLTNKTVLNSSMKILLFDIETAPMKAYVWQRFKENISLDKTISEWFMLCWSAKWLYSKEVLGDILTPEEIKNEDDYRIVTELWDLVNQADIVIAHNGDRFDIPKINSRFIVNGLPPVKPFISIDTCKVALKQFGFSSNKLDALAEYFGFKHKLDTDFNLWKECMEGKTRSLKYMLKYNNRDVTLLEEVYLKLRPYIKNHPNCSNFNSDINCCCVCGSQNYELLDNQYYYTQVGKYNLYRCKECGTIFRGRKNLNKPLPDKITIAR